MSATNYLGLNIPDKNSKGRVVTEVFEPNFTKLDQNAEVVDRDKNAIWGGLDGGGLIEDPSVTKVVGKRYIGADGKAYICLKPSNINNSDNYMPCNVVDNLNKLQNLTQFNETIIRTGEYYDVEYSENKLLNIMLIKIIPKKSIPGGFQASVYGLPNNYKQTEFVVTGNSNTTRPFRYSNGSVISFASQEVLNPSFYGSCILFKKD